MTVNYGSFYYCGCMLTLILTLFFNKNEISVYYYVILLVVSSF